MEGIADAVEGAGFPLAVPEASEQVSGLEEALLRLAVILPVVVEGAEGLQGPGLSFLVRDRFEAEPGFSRRDQARA